MFIDLLFEESTRFYYFSVVITVIISIVLHELAHGWAAIHEGDDTPIRLGHMTGDPRVHMGGLSLALVCVMGLGWGAMPVNRRNFRRKYSDALVSFAGPAMNLLLSFLALTTFALLMKYSTGIAERALIDPGHASVRFVEFLYTFGQFNIALFFLNMVPVPPLDGASILSDFHAGYRRWLSDRVHMHGTFFMMFFVLISMTSGTEYGLFRIAGRWAGWYLRLFY